MEVSQAGEKKNLVYILYIIYKILCFLPNNKTVEAL